MKTILIVLIALISISSQAYYTCYASQKSAKFIDIYRISGNTIETDSWDYYYGRTSDIDNDAMMQYSRNGNYDMWEYTVSTQENENIFSILDHDEKSNSESWTAKNNNKDELTIVITSDYAKRLPYGLRTWLKNSSYGYSKKKALLGTVQYGESHIAEVYCF